VLAAGSDPQVYATGILKVCQHYVQLPLACAAGVAGANLNHRMETIMENKTVAHLSGMKKSLLAATAAALVVTPLAAGLLWSPVGAAERVSTCELEPLMQTHTLVPYPMDSIHARETGAVLLQVSVARDGHVNAATVAHTSGHARLDKAAASFVQQHYLWRPNACGQAQTNVKVVFKLAPSPSAPTPSNP
jgi:TonB family protein